MALVGHIRSFLGLGRALGSHSVACNPVGTGLVKTAATDVTLATPHGAGKSHLTARRALSVSQGEENGKDGP